MYVYVGTKETSGGVHAAARVFPRLINAPWESACHVLLPISSRYVRMSELIFYLKMHVKDYVTSALD